MHELTSATELMANFVLLRRRIREDAEMLRREYSDFLLDGPPRKNRVPSSPRFPPPYASSTIAQADVHQEQFDWSCGTPEWTNDLLYAKND